MDIQGYIDDLNALNDYIRLAVAFGAILFGLFVAKYLIIRPWWKFVTATEVDWDDHLHRPLANRTYAFIIALGTQLTIRWTLGLTGQHLIQQNQCLLPTMLYSVRLYSAFQSSISSQY